MARKSRSILWVRRAPGARHRGTLAFAGHIFPCALGRSGIAGGKREGDGATPTGAMALVEVLYRADRVRPPRTRLPVRAIRPDDGWCDAPADRNYNRPVRLPYAASHEAMARADGLYDIVVVLDWNVHRRAKGRGSAIFLHIARPGFLPTEGCVAVTPSVMRFLLAHLGANAVIDTRPGFHIAAPDRSGRTAC